MAEDDTYFDCRKQRNQTANEASVSSMLACIQSIKGYYTSYWERKGVSGLTFGLSLDIEFYNDNLAGKILPLT